MRIVDEFDEDDDDDADAEGWERDEGGIKWDVEFSVDEEFVEFEIDDAVLLLLLFDVIVNADELVGRGYLNEIDVKGDELTSESIQREREKGDEHRLIYDNDDENEKKRKEEIFVQM